MAARRGKSQARRNQGNGGGVPGWAWGVAGLLIGIVVILAAPKLLKGDGDGFFRPRPNPDAQPAPAASGDDGLVADDSEPSPEPSRAASAANDAATPKAGTDYEFYDLLPGKEVPMTDAELAATAQAEERRRAAAERARALAALNGQASTPAAGTASPAATTIPPTAGTALPLPVEGATGNRPAGTTASPTPTPATATAATTAASTAPSAATVATPTAAAATDKAGRYLLQAGSFQASTPAEELKARIALLGLGARVESAKINDKTVYRVRMGPYASAGELSEAKGKLAAGGLPGIAIQVK
ncbi:SPOR domain-containing protein [Montanilutibacter psychrotolerans]|uniref:Sporulation protein n=1 Tax=Montanilutibacter psychrotolerans TaxID=1327343 RepID=A0A3M8SXC1_9GAMM|nr:SPOR domain-containing protein [Lysobacter psychrotolerans]RNF83884.1 sporulation protein [Lysobacter psychrotolerans]